jgi:hypothetical protein
LAESNVSILCWKKNRLVGFPCYFEIERIYFVLKGNSRQIDWESGIPQRVNYERKLLWHFKPGLIYVSDFEGEIAERVNLKDKKKWLDNGTGWFKVVLILSNVLQCECDVRSRCNIGDNFIFRLCLSMIKKK